MKAVKKIERKYYKYTIADWVQPVLTENGTIGGDSFAVKASSLLSQKYDAFHAFDGQEKTWFITGTPQPQWLIMYNPLPLNVSKIHYSHTDSNYWATEVDIQASKTGEGDWITLASFSGLTMKAEYDWDIDTNGEYYQYYRLYIKSASRTDTQHSARHASINKLILTALEKTTFEATQDDYDDYVDNASYYLPKTDNKYYGITG